MFVEVALPKDASLKSDRGGLVEVGRSPTKQGSLRLFILDVLILVKVRPTINLNRLLPVLNL